MAGRLSERFVIFDLDQTLIENAAMSDTWRRVCERHDVDLAHALEVWGRSAGRPMHEQVAEAFRISSADALVDRVVSDYWEELGEGDPTPMDGARETLERLSRAGVRLYLSTGSAPEPVEQWLSILGWHRHFQLVLASNRELEKGEAHYRLILEDAGLAPEEFAARALSVGDGVYDMRFALEHEVSLRVGYAPETERGRASRRKLVAAGANLLIEDLRDVVSLLESPDPLADPRFQPARYSSSSS